MYIRLKVSLIVLHSVLIKGSRRTFSASTQKNLKLGILQTLWSQLYILTYTYRSTVKEKYWPIFTTNVMTFHKVLSTFLHLWQHPLSTCMWSFHITTICYARACRNNFLYRARLLIIRLLEQDYGATRLTSSLQKFYGRHHELVGHYRVYICTMKTDLFKVS